MKTLDIGKLKLGEELFLFCGPCVIEDTEKGEDFTFDLAREIKAVAQELSLPFVFKASYDKANRTSHQSFRGPGVDRGLEILASIKERLDVPILTDVHTVEEAEKAGPVGDILQIPAFLCRQTDLVQAIARQGKGVNVKKGQFLAPWDMEHVVKKIEAAGQTNISLTERGASFGYNNLVSDMRSIPLMQKWGYPVVFDATHSVQLPGGQGKSTGGMPEMIPPLSRAAVAAGCQGLFIEVHPDPPTALSDGSNALRLEELKPLLEVLLEIHQVVKNRVSPSLQKK